MTETRGTPPSIQALVEISKLNPAQGESGAIDCPNCGGHERFRWLREKISGKTYGQCENCFLTLPKD